MKHFFYIDEWIPSDDLWVHVIAHPSFIYHSVDYSTCCCSHLKCQWFRNRKLFLCHKYQRGKHGAIPQERDASRTQLHCPFKPSVSRCVHLHQLGEQAALLSVDWKNIPHCSLPDGVSWTRKKKNVCAAFFGLVFLVNVFQIQLTFGAPPPSAPFRSYRLDIWEAAVCDIQRKCGNAQKDTE